MHVESLFTIWLLIQIKIKNLSSKYEWDFPKEHDSVSAVVVYEIVMNSNNE